MNLVRVCAVFALLAILLGCGTTTEGFEAEQKVDASRHGLVLTPDAQTSPGALCFTDIRDFHVAVGLEEPAADGWFDIEAPHSRAVLGGTRSNAPRLRARADLKFKVTGMNSAWDNDNYGVRRQACAEIASRNECNLLRACWIANGSYIIEKKSNPGLESLEECGEAGLTQLASGTLSALQVGATEYRISFQSTVDTDGFTLVGASFYEGTTLRGVKLLNLALPWNDGFAGFRSDRLTVSAKLDGQTDHCPTSAPCAAPTWQLVSANRVERERPEFTCGYYEEYEPPFAPMPPIGPLPPATFTVSVQPHGSPAQFSGFQYLFYFSAPPGVTLAHLYRDGHRVGTRPTSFSVLRDDAMVLPDRSYSYQVVYENGSGEFSGLATTRIATPPRPASPADDGVYDVAVVLFYYSDYVANNPLPFTPAEAENVLMGDAQSGAPFSPAVYIDELSRGQAALEASVVDQEWKPLAGLAANECGLGTCTFSPSLEDQVSPEFDAADYDFVMYFVHGPEDNNTPTWLSAAHLHDDGKPDHLLFHEMVSHGVTSTGHESGYYCDGDGASGIFDHRRLKSGLMIPGSNLADASSATRVQFPGSPCRFFEYGDYFSATSNQEAIGYFSTMRLWRLGWLDETEIAQDEFGGSYTLHRLGAGPGTRQLRTQLYDHTFYYAEYRTPEGADLRDTEGGAVPHGSGVHVRAWGVGMDGPWTDAGWLSEGVLMTQRALLPGETFCDPYRKVAISVLGADGDEADVEVVRGPCEPIVLPRCDDGLVNTDETDVDCGGSCEPCAVGSECQVNEDCSSELCVLGVCNGCSDGVPNGDESDLDCGGSCAACDLGSSCNTNADCVSTACRQNLCVPPSCKNSALDPGEIDVDCGPTCGPCMLNQSCVIDADCEVNSCIDNVCIHPTCTNGVKGGFESDVDCGGLCPKCETGMDCNTANDCDSQSCTNGSCD